MKKSLIIIASVVLAFIGIVYANGIYDHQVRQDVVENEHDFYDLTHRYHEMSPVISYRKDDASIDTIIKKMWDEYTVRQKEEDRTWNAPYKLITTYNHHEVVDFGDAKYIDSIKCIRFNQMVKERTTYDKQDSLDAVGDELREQSYNESLQRVKDELDRLNEKNCK